MTTSVNAALGALLLASAGEKQNQLVASIDAAGRVFDTKILTVNSMSMTIEMKRRMIVRDGNLDWEGKPIDARRWTARCSGRTTPHW